MPAASIAPNALSDVASVSADAVSEGSVSPETDCLPPCYNPVMHMTDARNKDKIFVFFFVFFIF